MLERILCTRRYTQAIKVVAMCATQSQLLEEYKNSVAIYQMAVSQLMTAKDTDEYLQQALKAEQFSKQCIDCRERLDAHQSQHRCWLPPRAIAQGAQASPGPFVFEAERWSRDVPL